jgi:hypothetical protein
VRHYFPIILLAAGRLPQMLEPCDICCSAKLIAKFRRSVRPCRGGAGKALALGQKKSRRKRPAKFRRFANLRRGTAVTGNRIDCYVIWVPIHVVQAHGCIWPFRGNAKLTEM